ncbi:hypothetical protein ACFXKJ_41145, partial [Kitasatospora indigofera]
YSLAGTYQRVHRAQVPVVVTNGRFPRDAVKWGAEQNVLLVDRELLGRWASSGRPDGFRGGRGAQAVAAGPGGRGAVLRLPTRRG